MKPKHGKVFEASVPSDFCHAGLEDAFEVINKYIKQFDVKTCGLTYLRVGIECDLLRVIDLSRTYGISPSFKKDYDSDEWSLHKLDKNFRHVIYWSPGA